MTGRGGPGEVADLGDQDRRGDRADPVDAFDALDLPAAGEDPGKEMSDRRGELVQSTWGRERRRRSTTIDSRSGVSPNAECTPLDGWPARERPRQPFSSVIVDRAMVGAASGLSCRITRADVATMTGTVELAVRRPQGWVVGQSFPIEGFVPDAPDGIGDLTGDGWTEIRVPLIASTGDKGWDRLYQIESQGPNLEEIPFDTTALEAMGIFPTSLHIESVSVDHVATSIGTCTPSCAEDIRTPVEWYLDRSGSSILRPVPPHHPHRRRWSPRRHVTTIRSTISTRSDAVTRATPCT